MEYNIINNIYIIVGKDDILVDNITVRHCFCLYLIY